MNKLWKTYTILAIVLFLENIVMASQPVPLTARVVSREVNNVTGKLRITLEVAVQDSIYFRDTRFKDNSPDGHPIFSSLGVPPFVKYKLYTRQDTFRLSYDFNYDKNHLPYYPVPLAISLEVFTTGNVKVITPPKNPHPTRDDEFEGEPMVVEAMARIYFTPYKTIEVWSEIDFQNLKRAWLDPEETVPQRVEIPRDSIPLSNLGDDIDTEAQPWKDEWNMVFVPGLPYSIPMERNTPLESINLEEAPENGRNGCGPARQRFSYILTGRLTTSFTNDRGIPITMPLSGLEIKFFENDLSQHDYSNLDDQYLGSTVTRDDGSFEFSFNICQHRWTEGGKIEVYLSVKANDPTWDVKAKTSFGFISNNNPPLFTRRAIIGNFHLGHNGSAGTIYNIGERNISDRSHRSVAFVKHALEFCNNNGVEVPGGISVWPYFPMDAGGFFISPTILYEVDIPIIHGLVGGRPSIFLSDGITGTGDENTIYHEFGHYLMWQLQQKNWLNPLTAGFVDYNINQEDNPNIAWTEGWANGFMAICDMGNYQLDQEFQRDDAINWEWVPIVPEVSIGYHNIRNIGAAMFDLFDGEDKLLQYSIPGGPFTVDDGGFDQVSLSLAQICQPIADHHPFNGGLLQDVDDYFRALVNGAGCEQGGEIKQVFDNNRVVNDAADFLNSGFSTDQVGINIEREYRVVNGNFVRLLGLQIAGIDVPSIEFTENFFIDHPIDSRDWSFNFGVPPIWILGQVGSLSDDLSVTGNGELYFNHQSRLWFFNQDGISINPPQGSKLLAEMCNGTHLLAENGGSIILGDPAAGNKATLSLGMESLLEIGDGGTLIIENGSSIEAGRGGTVYLRTGAHLIIRGSSEILVRTGGWLCVEPGVSIELQDRGSSIFAEQGANIGIHPDLGLAGNCLPLENIPFSGDGHIGPAPGNALTFDGIDDLVEIADSPELNLGTGDFTIEVFFQSYYLGMAPVHQILVGKRSYRQGWQADGFIFGIYTGGLYNGRLIAQFNGEANYLSEPASLFDGQCHQVGLVRKDGQITFYIDGVAAGTGFSDRSLDSPGPMHFGYDAPDNIFFKGDIGAVRIWTRARWRGEMANFDQELIDLQRAGLKGLWHLNQADGQEAEDISLFQNHGRLGNLVAADSGDPVWNENLDCDISVFFTGEHDDRFISNAVPLQKNNDSTEVSVIKAWPVPFEEEVKLVIESADEEQVDLTITDTRGNTVFHSRAFKTNELITIYKDLEKGIYIVRAVYSNKVKEMKIVKMK